MKNINWYISRFRTISIAEILFRILQRLSYKYQYNRRLQFNQLKIKTFKSNGVLFDIAGSSAERLDYCEEIEAFGKKFSLENFNFKKDLKDIDKFPQAPFYKIDIRTERFGNAKLVWELNRFLFLPQYAIAYRKEKDFKWLHKIEELVMEWDQLNPFMEGVNWYSNIEVNIRLINWVLTWEIIDGDTLYETNENFRKFADKIWFPLIYKHCYYGYKNPSFFSSANNHLISEYAGLFITTSKWNFKGSEKWNQYAKKGLEKEIVKQFSESGNNKEEAAEYIQFIVDFLILPYLIGENTGNYFSTSFKERLHQIFNYIASILDIKGNYPRYGDDDDGRVFIIDSKLGSNNFISLLSTAYLIFKDKKHKLVNKLDQKNIIFFGESGVKIFEETKDISDYSSFELFNADGHIIIKEKRQHIEQVYLHFDVASLGYLSTAAHGHSDALSLILHINGNEVLSDAGTYCYHTDKKWRAYFTSSLAHNTVTINKKNQAEFIGPTLWLKHYKTCVEETQIDDSVIKITGTHDGYQRFGYQHKRHIEYCKEGPIHIIDTVKGNQDPNFIGHICFHFNPDINIELNNELCKITCKDGVTMKMDLDSNVSWKLYKGSEEPIIGWHSPGFYKMKPSFTLVGEFKLSNIEIKTSLYFLYTE